ncbi:nicotinamide riboside transporter PnuC [Sporosarcina aquimarina]|uniref:nicotinamide riboside transporter PnuC n=1 Tax=Sporosarcina aquimarina TaxID=114975 RepID=UPI00203CE344|nr:nicotinamide riboside transporter PnuC [Sporosarcina aquimarina]MCM3758549.1 nicotinamide riboside transporter PnuC [Sporosarcina aquimarina]
MIEKLKGYLAEWSVFEKVWISLFTAITVYLYFAFQDTLLGLISSIAGMLCVVLVAKGKVSNYLFGIVQTVTYGYIAFGYGLYGEAMLNWLFYLPTQFIGIWMWMNHFKKKEDSEQGENVYVKRLTRKGWILVAGSFVVGALVYAELLTVLSAQQVRIDSMAVVLSVIAQILMVQRYAEQWVIWILVNILTITLWVITLVQTGGNDWNMVIMWTAFLVNSIYGYVNWVKLSKVQKAED